MDRERWQRVKAIFQEALDRPPEERRAFLEEACAADPGLRGEVEALFLSDEKARTFLEEPPAAAPAPDSASPLPEGARVGPFRLVRKLSSGGMGIVYEARQEKPRRTVAVKVMRAGLFDASALRRFEREAEVLARLRHPRIAQVIAAGTHVPAERRAIDPSAGIPYFAMEYVPGARPITAYTHAEHLSIRARIELFLQALDGVHHGHQRGIIHRDLKPGNILVDGSGQVKIIDFGVARATDADMTLATACTEAGRLVGTLQYMSPEQLRADPGELDVRSDVYSLGVVLYELLCDTPPYDVRTTPVPEAARVIRDKPPPRPSTRNRALRGDLETIVL